jgi:integrase/recombinase XerD
MHLLQAGVDITVIALWLGHESPVTTHQYVEADLAMKKRALDRVTEPRGHRARVVPSDKVLAFLDGSDYADVQDSRSAEREHVGAPRRGNSA